MIACISDGSLVGTIVLKYEDGNKVGSDVGIADGIRPGCADKALLGNAEVSKEGGLVGELVGEFDGTDEKGADGTELGCAKEAGV